MALLPRSALFNHLSTECPEHAESRLRRREFIMYMVFIFMQIVFS